MQIIYYENISNGESISTSSYKMVTKADEQALKKPEQHSLTIQDN
jgi:hypothetical protein